MKHGYAIWLLVMLSMSSCFKKEEPLVLPTGSSDIATFNLGQGYEKEVYFDLSTNSFQERRWADWDIRFESGKDGWGVFINTGKNMSVRKVNEFQLFEDEASDTNKIKEIPELLEPPEGKAATSAMNEWQSYKRVQVSTFYGIYVIELKWIAGHKRFKRLQIQAVNDSFYYVRITDIYDQNNQVIGTGETLEIPKDDRQNYTYYSFGNGGHVVNNAEPDKHTWDFVFTRYTHIFYNVLPNNAPFNYIVSGVLSNTNKVEVAKDSAVTPFDEINAGSISKYTFSTNRNAIGYDWKSHALGPGGAYTIAPKLTYIIRDTDGAYYKLRFLDYNNSLGQSGYPKFEFIRIK